MLVEPVLKLNGDLQVPGDKSISHRYAILGAMAKGTSRITNYSSSEDCHSTLGCVEALGVGIEKSGDQVILESPGWRGLKNPGKPLDAGNSGTTIRLLSAVLAALPFKTRIGGDESLNKRPMARIALPLSQMGANIEAVNEQFPPLDIGGGNLKGIHYELPVASAQVKSCVLLAGLMAEGRTTVCEKVQSRDHTERALPFFGAALSLSRSQTQSELSVAGPTELTGTTVGVPGDLSSAIFFVAAALLVPGSDLTLRNLGVNPTRSGLLQLLEDSGAGITRTNETERSGEPTADLRITHGSSFLETFPRIIPGEIIPNLIDEIPILAIIGTQLKQGIEIRNASELRKKESDRINAIVLNLRRIGAQVEEFPDGFKIPGSQRIKGGDVETFGDHRIAMAFSIAGLISESGVSIDQPGCADISFPGFYSTLQDMTSHYKTK